MQNNYFCASHVIPRGFLCSLQMNSRNSLTRDLFLIFPTHSRLVHDVMDTDFWPQNGSTHGRVFTTFKRRTDAQEQKLGKIPLGICLFDPIVGINRCFLASVLP